MIKTLLFDLDGTLLPIDTDLFLSGYFKLLSKKIHWVDPEYFAKCLMSSTYSVINNQDPAKTNSQVFWDEFLPKMPLKSKELEPIFEEFYIRDFPKLSSIADRSPYPYQILSSAHKKGYELVIATNPVFPKSAIRERLRWTDALEFPYKLITCYETMHSTKPHIEYYKEILNKIDRNPEECMMIGNDVEEDMIAAKLGMKTFLVTDYMLNRKNLAINTDFTGSLKDLTRFIDNLEEVCQ